MPWVVRLQRVWLLRSSEIYLASKSSTNGRWENGNAIATNSILVSVTASLFAAMAAAQEPTYVQHENVVYGEADGVGLVMDVFTPKGKGNGLGIVDVISGAWHSDRGKIRDHIRAQMFQILCGKGYTVFAIRPGSVTKFGVLEMLAHLNEGIRWVKGHADSYEIDPNRLGLMGTSAGGHLACLAAVTATARKIGNQRRARDRSAPMLRR